ncbi:MAG TPA: TrmH family RNA methyltransferase [Candidatus Paceibacterota bacterium]|nr:TrmH family RNA methyltransferase [Candidatus Paceibacterota bacterium]
MQKKEETYGEYNAVAVLCDIRSEENVGSMFRTSDAVGITKLYLAGYTPAPLDKFNRPTSKIAKAALGAQETISWEHKKSVPALLKRLKKEGYVLVAVEQSENSVDYKTVTFPRIKIAIVVGNEVTGLSKSVLNLCDVTAEIPMKGNKESLNVSVAFGVAAFRIFNI